MSIGIRSNGKVPESDPVRIQAQPKDCIECAGGGITTLSLRLAKQLAGLPNERDGLSSLVDRMAAAGGEGFLREHTPDRRVEVGEFRIPKFKLSFGGSIKSVLEGIGVEAVFDPSRADLADVLEVDNSGDPRLYASDVYHKALIEVEEEGRNRGGRCHHDCSLRRRYICRRGWTSSLTIHPFAFFVVEESSGAVLFGGHRKASKKKSRAGEELPPCAAGLTSLALRLARTIQPKPAANGNLVFSPLSVYAAIALVAAGAAGDTLAELLATLGIASLDELDAALVGRLAAAADDLTFSSAVWHDATRASLTPAFRLAAFRSFNADTRAMDMRSREAVLEINAWVNDATNGLIESMIEDEKLPDDADVIVTNAIYFKGKWETPFKKRHTVTDKFHRLAGAGAVDARFMRDVSHCPRQHYIACHDGFKVLRLPYAAGAASPPPSIFSMCIFLPDSRDGLFDLLDTMTSSSSTHQFLQSKMPTKTVRVGEFMLPKFKLTFSDDIAGVLRGLGLNVTFTNGDFSNMVVEDGSGRKLTTNSVVHKAVIEVNKEGTEAAASTGGSLCTACPMRRPPVLVDFVADHPFAFFVVEETSGAVVFAGYVVDPSSSSLPALGEEDGGDDDDPQVDATMESTSTTANIFASFFCPAASPPPCPGLTELALRLARTIPPHDAADGNLVFSPLSVYAALALLAAGAAGDSLAELLAVLGSTSPDELTGIVRRHAGHALADQSGTGGPRVSFVSGVWHDKTRTLTPSFRNAAVKSFMAETRAADFRTKPGEAAKQINEWAKKATNNLIENIIDGGGGFSPETDIILANAIYFKGKWEDPFKKSLTITDKFHRLDGADAVDARFMCGSRHESHHIACHDGFKVLRLPYAAGGRQSSPAPSSIFSMCIFLPDEHDGLFDLLDKMASTPGFLQSKLPMTVVEVGKLMLPKFKLTFSGDMAGILHGLGLESTFTKNADLSKMVVDDGSGRRLTMNSVVHKAVIEVNEKGTKAAATAMEEMCSMDVLNPPPERVLVDFVADHPFAFFIIEETSGAVVFAGHVLDPSSTAGDLDDDDDDDDEDQHVGLMGCLRRILDRCCLAFFGFRSFVKFFF
uniref:Serpin domain-containing protein n=1 Tax=Leersia perrieri TaxID=77586 RepID=A0A0D9XQK6_9ORYZ